MKTLLPVAILCILFNYTYSQNVLTLQPDAGPGKDVEIFSLEPNSNMDSENLRGNAWTFNLAPGIVRALIEFDLSSIPTGSTVDSAFISLYSPTQPTTQTHSGDNESYLKRITSYWNENEVTWNIQPSTTDLYQVALARSSSEYQDYIDIDVTDMVNDMVNDPANSFGFMLRLQNEAIYRRMTFSSSDATTNSNHPKLVVYYTEPACNTIVLQPGPSGKDAEVFSLTPNSTWDYETIRGVSWTFSGSDGLVRTFLEFDLDGLPSDASIASAYLTLFSLESPHSQFNSGSNSAWLQRVTSDWGETSVTWNNQPSITPLNQVSLPASTLEYQDYRSIEVTDLVQDMVDDPDNSFGFRLSLQTEETYRRMTFASGDYDNDARHPRLEICYTGSVAVKPEFKIPNVQITPNPWSDFIHISSGETVDQYELEIVDLLGQIVFSQIVQNNADIPVKLLPNMYVFKLTDIHTGKIHVVKMIQQ